MLRRKVTESLTARIFLITVLILLGAGGITFGFIAWSAPVTYTAVINDDLMRQADILAGQLAQTSFSDCGPLLDEFIRSSGADAMLEGPDGQIVNTGSTLAIQAVYKEGDTAITYATDTALTTDSAAVTVTMAQESAVARPVQFADRSGVYTLHVTPRMKAENLAVLALYQIAPWLMVALLIFSLLCAFIYSRYITRPIVRLSAIAGKMARLDFDWACAQQRKDEIGVLGRSLDQMARRLSAALKELEAANHALRGEVEQERELDRQRMAFFSAASHELKTPVTILKGQLSGMLEGVDVYRDRDKYLLRSLQVTGRMERLIQEMLSISRMESGTAAICQKPVELNCLLQKQLAQDAWLAQQRRQQIVSSLTPGTTVLGDASLLAKAVGNLLSNACLYSPPGAEIRIWCGSLKGRPALTVENTMAHIDSSALPHLFEAFYREEGSRSRGTGGSGLGLYLTRMILERHGADCAIENTEDGVKASVLFPPSS